MSLIRLDDILDTDRFVIQEFFELQMNEPEISQEVQSHLLSLVGGDIVDFDHSYI